MRTGAAPGVEPGAGLEEAERGALLLGVPCCEPLGESDATDGPREPE